MLSTNQKHSHQFIEAYHNVGTHEKQCNVPYMIGLSMGHSSKVASLRRNLLVKTWGQRVLNPGVPP